MTGQPWRALFERAREFDVTGEDIRDALADHRADG